MGDRNWCQIKEQPKWTRRLLPRLLVLLLPQGLLVRRGRQPQQLLACQVEVQVGEEQEQHLVRLELLLVIIIMVEEGLAGEQEQQLERLELLLVIIIMVGPVR